jgi:hypothetical protein
MSGVHSFQEDRLMRKASIFACAALCLAVVALAGTAGAAPLSNEELTAILAQPTDGDGSCATRTEGALFALELPRPGLQRSACTAVANCASGTVSCSGNSSCTAVDSNCDIGQRGQVTCDGVTTLCPLCPCDDTPVCCRCERDPGDCKACCRCAGGTFFECDEACN